MNQDSISFVPEIPQDIELKPRTNLIVQPQGSVFHQHWSPRGHKFGSCMIHRKNNLMYINIPKCASSWIKPKLIQLDFHEANYHQDNLYHKHSLVVLRDPLERWLSGVCEYFSLYHSDLDLGEARRPFYELVLDLVTLDEHTKRQAYFITDLDPARSTYFYCDKNFKHNFSQYLNSHDLGNQFDQHEYLHTTEQDPTKTYFRSFFKQFLNNEKYVQHIKNHYRMDYELIRSVTFWKL